MSIEWLCHWWLSIAAIAFAVFLTLFQIQVGKISKINTGDWDEDDGEELVITRRILNDFRVIRTFVYIFWALLVIIFVLSHMHWE